MEGESGRRTDKGSVITKTKISATDEQTIAWICRANHPKLAETDASYTDGSGNNSSSTAAIARDTQTSRGSRRYASAVDAPGGEFFESSSSGHQAYTSQIADTKPEGRILAHQPSFVSGVSVFPCDLKRKRDFVEIHPANTRSLTRFAHESLTTPSGSQPSSINRDYGTPYHLQCPELAVTGPSITRLLMETMEDCDTPYYNYFV